MILVIDQRSDALQGWRQLLEDDDVEQAQSLVEASRLLRKQHPDVIIIDLAMGAGPLGGLSFIQNVRYHDPHIPVLVRTMHSDPIIVSRALEAGATGYVLKNGCGEELLRAIQKVRNGEPYINHELASKVAFAQARGTTNPLKRMTVRELQALALLAEGKTYALIAKQLHVSYKTAANICKRLKMKLDVRTLPELMRSAIHHLSTQTQHK